MQAAIRQQAVYRFGASSSRNEKNISIADLETGYKHVSPSRPTKLFENKDQPLSLKQSILNKVYGSSSAKKLSVSQLSSSRNNNNQKSSYTNVSAASYLTSSRKTKNPNESLNNNFANTNAADRDLQDLVISMRKPQQDGFYGYPEWLRLHSTMFTASALMQKSASEIWKVMRLVNFGEVLIPSGFVFEIVKVLRLQCSADSMRDCFLQAISHFLKYNSLRDASFTAKQINTYKPILEIMRPYCKPVLHHSERKSTATKQQNASQTKLSKVWDVLYEEAKTRSDKKTMRSAQSKNEQLKDCTFTPKIEDYLVTQTNSSSKIRKSQCSHPAYLPTDIRKALLEESYMRPNFFARPLDKKIFQSPAKAKGVEEHVQRTLASYDKKRKLHNRKPIYQKSR